MTDSTYSFKCLGSTENSDGTIERYILEVTDTRDGEPENFSVVSKHLLSAHRMKRILLGRKMFYYVTQRKRTKMLSAMFDQQLETIED